MNRKMRRAQKSQKPDFTAYRREQHEMANALPEKLTPVPDSQRLSIPLPADVKPVKAWTSRWFVVQLFEEENGVLRLSVNRSKINRDGSWEDGITWDELMEVKRELGYGDAYAIEIYPRDKDIINVSNIRHLWILPEPLPVGWFKE